MMRRALPTARLPDAWLAERGLASAEADARRRRYGANDIVEAPPAALWDVARDTAKDPMLWFLVGTSVLYAAVGQRVEALTLLAAIVPLAGMDVYLHRRTQASTEGLVSRLAVTVRVVRDGAPREVPARDVVVGDLALVGPGEPFPADGIIVAGAELQADESTLTGEAYPVAKRVLTDGATLHLQQATHEASRAGGPRYNNEEIFIEHEHWGFAGTRLLTGSAALRVAFTGGETVYGEIVRSAAPGARARTPLQGAIASLVTVLITVASVLCLIMAWARLRQGYGWVDALVSAVTLATAALPEEFPVVFTFFLGVGVYRLARRQTLVRRAVSVENIGRVSCICADKTGTITEGRLHLTHLLPAPDLTAPRLLFFAAIASRGDSGDPLDAAILRSAGGEGVPGLPVELLAIFPFTEGRRRESVIVRDPEGVLIAAAKGATETILAICELGESQREAWNRRMLELAGEGHRVIACAWRPFDEQVWSRRTDELTHGYRFAGLLAFEDPVRESVAHAVGLCREGLIHTIMVTGDHPLTARAVAREIGLGGAEPVVISGDEIEARIARGEGATLRRVDVIARAAPAQKLALVKALQDAGEIVAVTGDGVNDVPALQAADVGIAMGERGTRSAREVAAIVLLDDNFRTIVRAIGEGRQLFRNLQLSFLYLLMVHVPLVITAAFVPLAGYPLLYLPVHIVWLEMIIHPTALLVFQELPASERLQPIAAGGPARFFSRRDWVAIAAVGGLLTAFVVAGYLTSLGEGGRIEHGRAMALAVLTLASAALTAALSGLRTWTSRIVGAGTVALSVALVQTPVLARLLHLEPLHLGDWILAAFAAVLGCTPLVISFRDRG
jgi:Ca2+-transporting ATPase